MSKTIRTDSAAATPSSIGGAEDETDFSELAEAAAEGEAAPVPTTEASAGDGNRIAKDTGAEGETAETGEDADAAVGAEKDADRLLFCRPDYGRVTIIHRQDAMSGPLSVRVAENGVGSARVFAGPFRSLEALREIGLPPGPATYFLVGRQHGETLVYVGESSNGLRRLMRHRRDRDKAFADTAYVVTWQSGLHSKELAKYRQAKFASLIASSSHAALVGAAPEAVELPPALADMADEAIEQERLLLWDLGLTLMEPSIRHPTVSPPEFDNEAADHVLPDPTKPMFEMVYGGLWARGLQCSSYFIVLPGSEVRVLGEGGSEDSIVRRRRAMLEKRSILTPIPGICDRQRLNAGVAFWSKSIAARVLAGSHVPSNVWRPIPPAASLAVVE